MRFTPIDKAQVIVVPSFASPNIPSAAFAPVTMTSVKAAADLLAGCFESVVRAQRPYYKFRAVTTYAEAPSSLEDLLVASLDPAGIPVAREGSSDTIYGEEGNFNFRCWHDYGHLRYSSEMTTEDELELVLCQFHDEILTLLNERCPIPQLRMTAVMLYLADTVGQSLLCEARGHFPRNQTMFTLSLTDKLIQEFPTICETKFTQDNYWDLVEPIVEVMTNLIADREVQGV